MLAITLGNIFMFHAGEGFKRKNRQGILHLILGIGLWALALYIIYG